MKLLDYSYWKAAVASTELRDLSCKIIYYGRYSVCRKHFEDKDFIPGKKSRIFGHAVPSLHLKPEYQVISTNNVERIEKQNIDLPIHTGPNTVNAPERQLANYSMNSGEVYAVSRETCHSEERSQESDQINSEEIEEEDALPPTKRCEILKPAAGKSEILVLLHSNNSFQENCNFFKNTESNF